MVEIWNDGESILVQLSMATIVLLTDEEPIGPNNPVITLEEAEADPFCGHVASSIKNLNRDKITRLQFIELLMIRNSIRKWTEEKEYEEGKIPSPLLPEEFYVPTYLKGNLRYNYAEGDRNYILDEILKKQRKD